MKPHPLIGEFNHRLHHLPPALSDWMRFKGTENPPLQADLYFSTQGVLAVFLTLNRCGGGAADLSGLAKGHLASMDELVQEQRHLVHIRSKMLLSEILRSIGANEARYNCHAVTDGYVGSAEASVYGVRGGEEPFLVRAHGIPAIRPCDAEESAAHALIAVIKKECRVEIEDTNWLDMNRYHAEVF
ncbi:Os01g0631000 [Oryza sativa Japonica Group]|uniref:Os01g0631000 protein n=1 Tax=Oryza sativa subsp. japonica TaxID=39947 RepID=A0A0P0V5M3_ORYSJ|nr:Os01g0631000 [Oryza sativa Japonica Group]